jgi:NAD(P)-dependent dehydrogenase (short-subunit alcohol dehydrogenase family)
VTAAFERVAREAGKIEILVNNVWGGYEGMVEDGTFTWTKPFWEQGLWRWDAMFSAGVRAHYHASQLAAKSMVASRSGLIVNISFWAAQKHIANVAYGVSKAATDKMTADMAVELRPHGVTAVSLVPRIGENREGHGGGTLARPHEFRIPRVHWTCRRSTCGRSRRHAIHRNRAGGR